MTQLAEQLGYLYTVAMPDATGWANPEFMMVYILSKKYLFGIIDKSECLYHFSISK